MKIKNSLKGIIIFSFIIISISMISIIGYIAYSSWKASTNNIIEKMENDETTDIVNKIEKFINVPLYINEVSHNVIKNELVKMQNPKERDVYFAGVMKANPEEIYSFSFGTENGEYYGARRNTENQIEIMKSDAETGGNSYYYSLNEDLSAGKFVEDFGKFDARTRDWYIAAKKKGTPTFSPVYKHFVMNDLAITAAYPIYDNNGILKGVLGTHILLSKINTYLKEAASAKMATTYILDKNLGEVVANSEDKPNFIIASNNEMKGIKIEDIDNPYIIKAYKNYKDNSQEGYIIKTKDDKLHMKIIEFKKEGLDWLIITAIPEGQLTAEVRSSIHNFTILSIVILIIIILVWTRIVDYVLKPIHNLIKTTVKFAQGDLKHRSDISRTDEIGKLSDAFNGMAEKLNISICTLKETNTALLAAKVEADKANKAKSQFLANMSHEIRTPMNGILMMAQLLFYTDITDEQKEMINIIKNSSNSLLQIINDILDLSKIEAGKVELRVEAVNIIDLVSGIEKLFKQMARNKSLNFKTNIEKDVPADVFTDSTRLTQVITNLLGNSIKFTEKGEIELRIKKVKSKGDKIQLMISVSDTGIGIKEEDIPKLFNYFTQLDDTKTKKFKGTGLGLAISKRIVEMMNGEICVESEFGKGSTFHFTCWVDMIKEERTGLILYDKKNNKYSNESINILLVEDDYVSQIAIKQICKMNDWNLVVASNGKEALDIFEENKFDLILMDIQMPEMNGIDVTKIIRQKERTTGLHIPIIATTAYAMNNDKEEALSSGMDDYISKPIDKVKLEKVIENFIKCINKSSN